MLFLISLFSTFVFAQNSALDSHLKGHVPEAPLKVVSIFIDQDKIHAGSRMPVTLKVTMAEGFSAYEEKFTATGIAPAGLEVSDVDVKPVVEFMDFAKKKHRGLQNAGELKFFVELPKSINGTLKELLLEIHYVACNQKFCLPLTHLKVNVPVNITTATVSMDVQAHLEKNLFLAFLIVFGFGFLTSLTPCVYPLIPITLAVIGARSSKKSTAFLISLIYVIGIAITYALLGLAAAKTGALFGQALSYPPVLIGFSLIFFLMGLSLLGLFEIRPPHALTNLLTQRQSSAGYAGAFFSGMIAGVVASPCVGPVLVSILAYIAQTQNTVLGFFLLFTFAMGMGVLLIVIGTYSSLLKNLPRSGAWMVRIKAVLGIVMFVVAFYYIKPFLPTVKITDHSFSVSTPGSSTAPSGEKYANGWQPYSADKVEQAKKDGKPVIIDFYADWCAACNELDAKTFSTPEFIEESKKFVLLKVDATENFEGLSDLQRKYEVYGLPTIVFISKEGRFLNKESLTGFEDVKSFLARMTPFSK